MILRSHSTPPFRLGGETDDPSPHLGLTRLRGRGLIGSGVVVDVRELAVLLVLVSPAVFVAVRQLGVVVLMGVPVRSMLPFAQPRFCVVMGDVIVIVDVSLGGVGVLRLLTLFLSALLNHSPSVFDPGSRTTVTNDSEMGKNWAGPGSSTERPQPAPRSPLPKLT
jgi:hypothetical protein